MKPQVSRTGLALEVLVLGMHHTGTSMLSNLTMELGLHGGTPGVFLRHPTNPMKYWEREDVVELNQAQLDSRDPFVPDWIGYDFTAPPPDYDDQVEAILAKLRAGSSQWVTKDPRLALFADRWIPRMLNPVCLVIRRDPADIVASLRRYRPTVPLVKWARVVTQYYMRIEEACRNVPHIAVSHERLTSEPIATMVDVASQLSRLGGIDLRVDADRIETLAVRGPILETTTRLPIPRGVIAAAANASSWIRRRNETYATIVTTDDPGYLRGAVTLAKSIQRLDDERDAVALVVDVSSRTRRVLQAAGWRLVEVGNRPIADPWFSERCSRDFTDDQIHRWGAMANKLHLWTLPYERVVYLDADAMLVDIPDTASVAELGAEHGKHHAHFNAGVLILRPDVGTFERLKTSYLADDPPDIFGNGIDCTEQALLNQHFGDVYTPFRVQRPDSLYEPHAFAVHWITRICPKPWEVEVPEDVDAGCDVELYEAWWDLSGNDRSVRPGRRLQQRRTRRRSRRPLEYDNPKMWALLDMARTASTLVCVAVIGLAIGAVLHRTCIARPADVTGGMSVIQAKRMGFKTIGTQERNDSSSDDESSDEELASARVPARKNKTSSDHQRSGQVE